MTIYIEDTNNNKCVAVIVFDECNGKPVAAVKQFGYSSIRIDSINVLSDRNVGDKDD